MAVVTPAAPISAYLAPCTGQAILRHCNKPQSLALTSNKMAASVVFLSDFITYIPKNIGVQALTAINF